MSPESFLEEVEKQVSKEGGTCWFSPERSVPFPYDNTDVNGYWDEEDKKLVAAVGQPVDQWLPLVAHEFSHFCQWRDKREAYWKLYKKDNELTKRTGKFVEEIFFDWLEGDDSVDLDTVFVAGDLLRDMELDCERVTLENIKKYDLPIDPVYYCQKSSAYIHFYNVIKRTRKWYSIGNEPYNNKNVIEVMPKTLDGSYDTTPEDIMQVIIENCLGEVHENHL